MRQRLAARLVEALVPAVELGGARDAQPVAQARQHDLPREIGERHGGAPRGPHADRRGIALRGIHVARHADRLEQERAVAAERHHVRVGGRHLEAPVGVVQSHALQAVAVGDETIHRHAEAQRAPRAAARSASPVVNACASPDSSVR
jgi:hypothetical protein